jgi:hypothetical protein
METSNNLLVVMVVIAMAVSIAGTMTLLSVIPGKPFSITGFAQSEQNATTTATVASEANINIVSTSTVAFGAKSVGATDDTTDMSPHPITIENNGSVAVNISIGIFGSNLWGSVYNDGNFTFNVSKNETAKTTWVWGQPTWATIKNSTAGVETSIMVFNLSPDNADGDRINVHLKIIVPPNEKAGAKTTLVKFNASIG